MAEKNGILKLMKKRRNVLEFSERRVGRIDLLKIIEAGRWAPSSHNSQPWKFIIVEDAKTIAGIMKLCTYGYYHTAPAALIVAVLVPPERIIPGIFRGESAEMAAYHKYIDIGQPVLSMAYEAESLGINSCLLSLQEKEASSLLHVPIGNRAILAIGLGHERKGAHVRKREREKTESLVYFERYGRR